MTRQGKPKIASYLDFAHDLADIAAEAILPHFRRRLMVTDKGGPSGFDPVTVADRAAEKAIRATIAKRYPDHGVVGEEYPEKAGAGRHSWVVDPIDGTRAFIMGSPLWGTLVALVEDGAPALGLMNQPFTQERFWGAGRRAHMRAPNGRTRTLRTRACGGVRDAVMTTTHPDLFASRADAAGFERLKGRARMTRYGGDCYGYCLLAAGFVDIVVEVGLKPHDVAALIPIIEGAGGRITTWDNAPAMGGGRILAAGDPRVHKAALELLHS